jgi:hypothetical protein
MLLLGIREKMRLYVADLHYLWIGKRGDMKSPKNWIKRLDPKIRDAVLILRKGGIETFESCQGGKRHCSEEPFIRFHGHQPEGLKAVSVALYAGLKVSELRRIWTIRDRELNGAWWEMIFSPTKQKH